jgi:hypothetical protein
MDEYFVAIARDKNVVLAIANNEFLGILVRVKGMNAEALFTDL